MTLYEMKVDAADVSASAPPSCWRLFRMPTGYAVIGEIHCGQDWGTCGASHPAERPTAGREVIAVAVRSLKTLTKARFWHAYRIEGPQTAGESILPSMEFFCERRSLTGSPFRSR
jgi:hypothetical protein